MTMTARTTRRFVACLGFTNTPTNERFPRTRMHANSTNDSVRPTELIPVLERSQGGLGPVRSVGTIYDAFVMGTMILGIGYLVADTHEDAIRIEALTDGSLALELDIDGRMREHHYGVEYYGWKVRAVTIGTNPCWILPPVHVWKG